MATGRRPRCGRLLSLSNTSSDTAPLPNNTTGQPHQSNRDPICRTSARIGRITTEEPIYADRQITCGATAALCNASIRERKRNALALASDIRRISSTGLTLTPGYAPKNQNSTAKSSNNGQNGNPPGAAYL